MRVVDTSAWIEWLAASPAGANLAGEIPAREAWLVPTIVQLELTKWLNREAGDDKADQVTAFTSMCVVCAARYQKSHSRRRSALCAQHRLATADAIALRDSLAL